MSRYFTEKITTEELEDKIRSAWRKHPAYREVIPRSVDATHYHTLTPTVEEDLSKVGFDVENMSASYFSKESEGYIGFNTLDNALTYLGVVAGGDWETPLFFIIYWDGSKLRGYIPKDGNPWNTETNEAYGNNNYEEDEKGFTEDDKNAKKRGWKDSESAAIDYKRVVEDIKKRIIFKSPPSPKKD